ALLLLLESSGYWKGYASTRRFPMSYRLLAGVLVLFSQTLLSLATSTAQDPSTKSSYDQLAPVLLGKGSFQSVMAKDKADKPAVMARQQKMLEERYDLTPRPDKAVKMSRGKPIQDGPAAKLPQRMTW